MLKLMKTKKVCFSFIMLTILLISMKNSTSVRASSRDEKLGLETETIIKNEDGKVLENNESVRIEDILTYQVIIRNNTGSGIIAKITNEIPETTSVLLPATGRPWAKLSNGDKVYINKFRDELMTDKIIMESGEEIILEFDVVVEIPDDVIKNLVILDYYPEGNEEKVETITIESKEIKIDKEENLLTAEILYIKKWEATSVMEESYGDIDARYRKNFTKDSGINTRVKDILSGFSYINLSEIYINREIVDQFSDSFFYT